MAEHSKIEWTDATWNPVRGCTKISPGCKHCYAERFAERFRGVKGHPFEQGFDLRLIPGKARRAASMEEAEQRIFVNSMSDLFHDEVPLEYIQHVFRRDESGELAPVPGLDEASRTTRSHESTELPWASHIWMGVSVENKDYLWRIDHLHRIKAHVKFLSIEPLLGPLGKIKLRGIDWVIVGGESGPGARPMTAEWVKDIRDQCRKANVAFFFKQWGGVQKKRHGRELDGRTWDEMPELVTL